MTEAEAKLAHGAEYLTRVVSVDVDTTKYYPSTSILVDINGDEHRVPWSLFSDPPKIGDIITVKVTVTTTGWSGHNPQCFIDPKVDESDATPQLPGRCHDTPSALDRARIKRMEKYTKGKRVMAQIIADGDLKPFVAFKTVKGEQFIVGDTNQGLGRTDHCKHPDVTGLVDEMWTINPDDFEWQDSPQLNPEKYTEPLNILGGLQFNGKLQPGTLVEMEDGEIFLIGDVNALGGICDNQNYPVNMSIEEQVVKDEVEFERLVKRVKILIWKR